MDEQDRIRILDDEFQNVQNRASVMHMQTFSYLIYRKRLYISSPTHDTFRSGASSRCGTIFGFIAKLFDGRGAMALSLAIGRTAGQNFERSLGEGREKKIHDKQPDII